MPKHVFEPRIYFLYSFDWALKISKHGIDITLTLILSFLIYVTNLIINEVKVDLYTEKDSYFRLTKNGKYTYSSSYLISGVSGSQDKLFKDKDILVRQTIEDVDQIFDCQQSIPFPQLEAASPISDLASFNTSSKESIKSCAP